jgi:hypothetical protein
VLVLKQTRLVRHPDSALTTLRHNGQKSQTGSPAASRSRCSSVAGKSKWQPGQRAVNADPVAGRFSLDSDVVASLSHSLSSPCLKTVMKVRTNLKAGTAPQFDPNEL